ncbi:MAG TPA: DMT family transporter [Ruminiclostridium sp.]|nr:DMT family transporter [Ruminiclostridium sp.]
MQADNSLKTNSILVKVSPFILLTAVLIWGYSYIVTKNILNVTSPVVLTCVGYIYSGIAGIPVIISRRKYLKQKSVWVQSAVLGVLIFASRLVQVIGCDFTTAGKNAFVTSAYVVIVPILGWMFFKQKLRPKNVILALLTLTGIGIIALNDNSNGINIGDLLTFAGSIGFGIHIIYNSKYVEKNDPILLGVLQLEAAAVIAMILMGFLRPGIKAEFFTWDVQRMFLYNGVFGTLVGFLLQSFAQKYLNPNRTSLIISTESVSGAVFSAIFLGEKYGPRLLIGCFIVLAANISASVKTEKKFMKNQLSP